MNTSVSDSEQRGNTDTVHTSKPARSTACVAYPSSLLCGCPLVHCTGLISSARMDVVPHQKYRAADGVTDAEPVALCPRIVGWALVASSLWLDAALARAARLVHEPGRGGHQARQRQGRGHQALRKHDLPCTTKSHHVWHVKAGVRIYLSPSTRTKPEINNSPGASQSSLTRESRSGASQTYCSVNDAWGRARVSATELSRDAVPSSHEPPAILPNPRVQFLISPLSVSSLLRKQAVTYQFVRCRILLHKIQPNPQSLPPTTCSLFVRFLCSVDPTRIRSWN
jgi:hypothetical protein